MTRARFACLRLPADACGRPGSAAGPRAARRALAAPLALALALLPDIAQGATDDACAAPEHLWRIGARLERTVAKLRAGGPLTVVAIGSSSTAGAGASAPERAYPHRLGVELGALFPGAAIRVLNKGVGGETTARMIERFDRDVFAHLPDLVIWQVGSNAILRGEPAEDYARSLRHGIDRLQAVGADVVLMDPQHAPRLTERTGYEAVVEATWTVGRAAGVPVFQRSAIMRLWAESGTPSSAAMLSADRLHLNDASYGCLAKLLARALADAAG
jgi:lysophospholipase L1-like esterase